MKTPYELESLGWKITPIKYTFSWNIFHAFHFPYGHELRSRSLNEVLTLIDNFIKEEHHKEGIERFNLDR